MYTVKCIQFLVCASPFDKNIKLHVCHASHTKIWGLVLIFTNTPIDNGLAMLHCRSQGSNMWVMAFCRAQVIARYVSTLLQAQIMSRSTVSPIMTVVTVQALLWPWSATITMSYLDSVSSLRKDWLTASSPDELFSWNGASKKSPWTTYRCVPGCRLLGAWNWVGKHNDHVAHETDIPTRTSTSYWAGRALIAILLGYVHSGPCKDTNLSFVSCNDCSRRAACRNSNVARCNCEVRLVDFGSESRR